jgi:hypothetical protein
MAERVTTEEFERLQQQAGSRWSDLVTKLKESDIGESFRETLRAHEDNGSDRQRARQAIHMLCRYHGMRVQLTVKGTDVLVRKLGLIE